MGPVEAAARAAVDRGDELDTPTGAGRYETAADAGTLDHYLKQHVNRATAGWVASLLERAGVVELDRGRPARVRLRKPPWEPRPGAPRARRMSHAARSIPGGTFVCSMCMLRKSESQRRGPDICADCA